MFFIFFYEGVSFPLYLNNNIVPKSRKNPIPKDILNITLLYLFLNSLHCFNVWFKKYLTPGSIKVGLVKLSEFIY